MVLIPRPSFISFDRSLDFMCVGGGWGAVIEDGNADVSTCLNIQKFCSAVLSWQNIVPYIRRTYCVFHNVFFFCSVLLSFSLKTFRSGSGRTSGRPRGLQSCLVAEERDLEAPSPNSPACGQNAEA